MQTKLREGNVFTGMCYSVHRRGLPPHNTMGRQTPPPPIGGTIGGRPTS